MANLYETISQYIRPYYSKILYAILLGIFLFAAYYAYGKWGQPKPKANADIYQPSASKDATIYFFFADWCPHCKKAKPVWAQFTNKYDGKVVNGSKIICVPVDCTDAEKPETAQMINQFSIASYPTVKMVKDGNTYEFDAKITEANLEEFIKS